MNNDVVSVHLGVNRKELTRRNSRSSSGSVKRASDVNEGISVKLEGEHSALYAQQKQVF